MRASSVKVRAGIRISPRGWSSPGKAATRTARRNASAAAKVIFSPPTCTNTPVKTGRESSSAAAKATSAIISLSRVASSTTGGSPSSALGISGNSDASKPFMFALLPRLLTFRVLVSSTNAISTGVCGKLLTKSVSSFAGTVVVPSSSICASTQQLMPISKLVADSFRRPWSVVSKILDRIGSVLRLETAWLTANSPRLRSCCLHVIFTMFFLQGMTKERHEKVPV